MQEKTGLLLLNLGTPKSPHKQDVRHYLKEFLSDPRVIDLPTIARMVLLYGVILPFRPKKSAKAYQKIWTQEGSPLLINSQNLLKALEPLLGKGWELALGMRYGEPNIDDAIKQLMRSNVNKIMVLPLFPQYASSSYGSAVQKVYDCVRHLNNIPAIEIIPPFYDRPEYISALAKKTNQHYQLKAYDHLVISFHGLPERHVIASDGGHPAPGCDLLAPCPAVGKKNQYCYRAQSYATARALAEQLDLTEAQYTVSFQSRLGKTPWIKPYTDEHLAHLFAAGHKNLAVVCPSFTSDCLETIEEIGITLKESWQKLGGQACDLIPCLNDDPAWAKAIANWLNKNTTMT